MSETTVCSIVANRTASTPALLAEVHRRRESCRYGLMVPPEAETDWSLDDAVRLVGRAADQGIGLTDRVQHLGVPVTVIPPDMKKWGPVKGFPDEWTRRRSAPRPSPGSATTRRTQKCPARRRAGHLIV